MIPGNEDLVQPRLRLRHEGARHAAARLGDPYFSHPLESRGILADMSFDAASICTALLHDTVEDTEATIEEIAGCSGPRSSGWSDGVTKLSKIKFQTRRRTRPRTSASWSSPCQRNIRVLLVKLADRCTTMRTLHFIQKPEKRARIALETSRSTRRSPSASASTRIKEELEDLSFGTLTPRRGKASRPASTTSVPRRRAVVARIIAELQNKLKEAGVAGGQEATSTAARRRANSIWKKMQRKNISFEQLSDIMAFRVMVPKVEDCYHALASIHGLYPTCRGASRTTFLPSPTATAAFTPP